MKITVRFLLALFVFAYTTSSFSEEVKISAIVPKPSLSHGLSKTGQIAARYPSGWNKQRDDGYYKMGLPEIGESKYTLNPGGLTITDNATGLIWTKNTWNASDQDAAFSQVVTLRNSNYGNRHDWRVPNVKELHSLLHYGSTCSIKIGEEVDDIEPFVASALKPSYWTSTSMNTGENYLYWINFSTGYIGAGGQGGDSLRAVAGGQGGLHE